MKRNNLSTYILDVDPVLKPYISVTLFRLSSLNTCRMRLMFPLLFKSPTMRSTFTDPSSNSKDQKVQSLWASITLRILLRLDSIQRRLSFFQMSNTFNIYTLTLLEFKSTWTSTKLKEFSALTNQIMLESLRSLLFKQHQLLVTLSLIFLERERVFPVWFLRLLTRIPILEWLETLHKS